MFLLKILIALYSSIFVHSGLNRLYYITNSTGTTCELYQPCYTVDYLARNTNIYPQGANVTLIFLSQNYLNFGNLKLNFAHLSQLEWKPWQTGSYINFHCIGSLSILVWNVTQIKIASTNFRNCGQSTAVVTFLDSSQPFKKISFISNHFVYNQKGSIKATGLIQKLYIEGCFFDRNYYGFHINVSSKFSGVIVATIFVNNDYNYITFTGLSKDAIRLSLFQCQFMNNFDSLYMLSLSEVNISNCKFLYNSAATGGAIYFYNEFFITTQLNNLKSRKSVLCISDTLFYRNSAEFGGALAVFGFSNFTMFNCKLTENHAEQDGGALQASFGKGYLINCYFIKNYAVFGGSISFKNLEEHECFSYTSWIVRSSFFYNNTASHGGAIYVYDDDLFGNTSILHSNFIGNKATVRGAGIALIGSVAYQSRTEVVFNQFLVQNCQFIENIADNNHSLGGGILLIAAIRIKLKFCIFHGNRAKYGGAVYINFVSDCKVETIPCRNIVNMSAEYCVFNQNEAFDGGAVYLVKTRLYVTGISFLGNIAHNNGGGICLNKAYLLVSGNVTFRGNYARVIGGAVFVEEANCMGLMPCTLSCVSDAYGLITLQNNSAAKGLSMYGGIIKDCEGLPCGESIIISNRSYESSSREITSNPMRLCYCSDEMPTCMLRSINRAVFPGEALDVQIACVDQLDQPVSCQVRTDNNQFDFDLGQGECNNVIQQRSCLKSTFHVYSNNFTEVKLSLIGSIDCEEPALSTLIVNIKILSCPLGFQILNSQCDCHHYLRDIFPQASCNIQTELITINKSGWFTFEDGYFKAQRNCPLDYCNSGINLSVSNPDSQCALTTNRGEVVFSGVGVCVVCVSILVWCFFFLIVLGSWIFFFLECMFGLFWVSLV